MTDAAERLREFKAERPLKKRAPVRWIGKKCPTCGSVVRERVFAYEGEDGA